MHNFHYNDFTQLFLQLNKELLVNIDEYAIDCKGPKTSYGPLFISTDNCSFNFDLSKLAYTETKMKMLIHDYINVEEYVNFRDKLDNATGTSTTFYFNQKKPRKGTASYNGPCLVAIVFTRNTRKSAWEQAHVYYRTTELNRRFAADLALLSMLFREFTPEVKQFNFYIPMNYFNSRAGASYLHVFNVGWHNLNPENPMHKFMFKFRDEFLEGNRNTTYKCVNRMILAYNGAISLKPLVLSNKLVKDYLQLD